MYSKFLIAAALVASASAACPNACSGHGRCTNFEPVSESTPLQSTQLKAASTTISAFGYDQSASKKDSCTCFTHLGHNGGTVYQWTGADCSLQTCPYAPSFSGYPHSSAASPTSASHISTTGAGFHTQSTECSSKGVCDRKTGQCACFDGYEGDACHRSKCPNSCNGAGKCLTLKQIAEDVFDANAHFYGNYMNTAQYTGFDSEQMMGCVCDAGRSGADCSIIDCPSTADIMGGPGASSGRTCSGRGICDGTTGTCSCFDGYFGTDCAQQRNRQM